MHTVGDTTANAITPAVAVLDESGLVRIRSILMLLDTYS